MERRQGASGVPCTSFGDSCRPDQHLLLTEAFRSSVS
jgi:hypothetical protein